MIPRYGKFQFSDFLWDWFVLVSLQIGFWISVLSFKALFTGINGIIMLITSLSIIVLVTSRILFDLIVTQREQFAIGDNIITAISRKKEQAILIPSRMTLVLTHASIVRPTDCDNSIHPFILKGRYMLTILDDVPLGETLKILHRKKGFADRIDILHKREYFADKLEIAFQNKRFVYSFVCNDEMLEHFLEQKEYQLIVPESLLSQISINLCSSNVVVDEGF